MAILDPSSPFNGFNGTCNGFVFRTVKGKTIISRLPRHRRTNSAKQKATRDNFREAVAFAREQLLDPETRKCYEELAKMLNLPNANLAAVKHYLNRQK